jgi:hypothetical protein
VSINWEGALNGGSMILMLSSLSCGKLSYDYQSEKILHTEIGSLGKGGEIIQAPLLGATPRMNVPGLMIAFGRIGKMS